MALTDPTLTPPGMGGTGTASLSAGMGGSGVGGPGNGGQAWTPKSDEYGNPLSVSGAAPAITPNNGLAIGAGGSSTSIDPSGGNTTLSGYLGGKQLNPPESSTIMDAYNQRTLQAQNAGAAERSGISADYGQQIEDTKTDNQRTLTGHQEEARSLGPASLAAVLGLESANADKRVRTLERNRDIALANSNTNEASRIDKLITDEHAAITTARQNYLQTIFATNAEQRAQAGFQTPDQQSVRQLMLQAPDAKISPNDTLQDALAKYRGSSAFQRQLSTPVSIPFGASYLQYNQKTGKYEQQNGVFDNSNGTGSTAGGTNAPFNPTNTLDSYTLQYLQTGELPSKIAQNPQYTAPIIQRANELSGQLGLGNFDPAQRKASVTADTTSLNDLQNRLDNSQASLPTIIANGKLLLNGMKKAGINDQNSPLINQYQNALNKKLIGSGDLAAFNNSLTTIRNEYARLLMGKGSPTDKATNDADSAVPNNISAADLAKVLDRISGEGNNVISSLTDQIGTIKKRISPYNFSTSTTSRSLSPSNTSTASAPSGWAGL